MRDVAAALGVVVAWGALAWLACAVTYPPVGAVELATASAAAAGGSLLAIGATRRDPR